MSRRVVVIGAGMAGLAAAVELSSRPGTDVVVIEAADEVGGKLRQHVVAGESVDVGAESLLARRPEALDLIEDIGASDRVVHPRTASASVWSRGRLEPLPRGTVMGVPGNPDALRGLLTDAEVARTAAERPWSGRPGTDVAVGEYIGTRLGPAVVDRLVGPLLGGVYAGDPARLSFEATLPQLFSVTRDGGSLLEAAARIASARTSGSGSEPAPPVFAGLVGGVGRLPGLVAEALVDRGVTLRLGSAVRSVERTDTGWRVVTGPPADPVVMAAEGVIVATPAPVASRLLAPTHADLARELGAIPTASMAVITIAVDRAGMEDLPGSGFLVPEVDGAMIKASTFSSAKWGWVDGLSPELCFLRASVGRFGDTGDLDRTDDDLVTAAVTEIGAALGRPVSRPRDAHVQRWPDGIPQYLVGQVGLVERIRSRLATEPTLGLAGAAYDGVGVPAVIASGRAAARTVMTHLRETIGDEAH